MSSKRRKPEVERQNLLKQFNIQAVQNLSSPLEINETKMCATGVFSTSAVDRVGDIVETNGIRTHLHQFNPVVFLDHGIYYNLPIGKTEDEEGNYTVDLETGTQITYFSQKSQVAEQTFALIAEGILRGNSLRYENGNVKRIPADPKGGYGGGWHVLDCDLVELSWVGLPANQECVTSLLESPKGKSLHAALKSMLMPHKLNRKVWSNGAKMIEEDKEEVKLPLGAKTLKEMHSEIKEMVDAYESGMEELDNPKVKNKLSKLLDSLKGVGSECASAFKSHYPDLEQLEEEVQEEVDEEVEEEEEEEEIEDEDKCLSILKKSLSTEKNSQRKQRLEQAIKSLEVEEEELTAEEKKELARVERAIERKLKLFGLKD